MRTPAFRGELNVAFALSGRPRAGMNFVAPPGSGTLWTMKPRQFMIAACFIALLTALSIPKRLTGAQESKTTTSSKLGYTTTFERPLYYSREITERDLVGRRLWELTLLRNTIYARAGNSFRKKWLADYFSAQPWYHAMAIMDESKLSALDRKNAEIIAKYDASLSQNKLQFMLRDVMGSVRANGAAPEDKIELRLLSTRLGKWVGSNDTPEEERSPLEDPAILDKQLSVEQLQDLSRRDLRLLRNTIYARHGRPFHSDLLRAYFEAAEWYKADPAYTEARLSPVDNRNIKLIRSVEDQLGGPLTDFEHKNDDGWIIQA
jgi:hypothetical protein